MEGEKECFWLFLFDLEGLGHLPTYPQVESKNVFTYFYLIYLCFELTFSYL